MDTLLEMRAITKEFPGVKALDTVNLTVQKGEIHAICGENGAGKTTLIRCLMNELEPIDGVVKWSENASVGYCPQDSGYFFDNRIRKSIQNFKLDIHQKTGKARFWEAKEYINNFIFEPTVATQK